MPTECTTHPIVLQAENNRTVTARFDGGTICSDAGAILLKRVEQVTGIIRKFAACFTDHRNPDLIDHTLYELIAQRVYALALGYEDLNDHEDLRHDLLLAALVGKKDPHTEPLAGKSTLNRMELTPVGADKNSRYKKIVVHRQDVDRFLVDVFIQSYKHPPVSIILDLDATEFPYQTRDSWSRSRRVVGKAEMLSKGPNPRFVVTSFSSEQRQAQPLYEALYCGRGDMENRIKEQQLYLFADRTSCATMRANQTRLWFSSVAYLLLEALRRMGLKGTEMAHATCQTIRLKLLKIGAQIQVTVRKVWVRLSQSYPYQALFRQIHENLTNSQSYYPLRC